MEVETTGTFSPGSKNRTRNIIIVVIVILIAVLILIIVLYLTLRPGPKTNVCTNNADCAANQVCTGGICTLASCTSTTDCAGYPCTNGECNRTCTSDSTCLGKDKCINATCSLIPCTTVADCVQSKFNTHGDLYCGPGAVCDRLSEIPCTTVTDCPTISAAFNFRDPKGKTYINTLFQSICSDAGFCGYGTKCATDTACNIITSQFLALAPVNATTKVYAKTGTLSVVGVGNMNCVLPGGQCF